MWKCIVSTVNDIYQQIWDNDRHKLSVSPRGERGEWLDPEADILLDEQIQAFGRRDLDLAKKPLFRRVNEAKIQTIPTYRSLIRLLDNYKFNNRQSEIITKAEKAEIDRFIDDICQTKPIEIARNYINRQLCKLSKESFKQSLKSIWFDLYTNYYGGGIIKDASGFEHIFVGEGKYRISSSDDKILGAISGYHNWLKFYFDEKERKVNYLGYSYDLKGVIGQDNPYVVSTQIRWQNSLKDMTVELFKKRGCFFVGTSPECEIAMGTVAHYESLANYKFADEKRRTIINGAVYDLVLYRNTKLDGSRGNYIRSFYPIYLGNN